MPAHDAYPKKKFSTDIVRNVYDDSEGAGITIRPSSDNPAYIEILTLGEENKKYFGDFKIILEAEYAEALAQAILASAKEAKASK